MKRSGSAALALLLCMFTSMPPVQAQTQAQERQHLPISMMYSNSSSQGLPFDLVSKGRWQPDPNARFVKLHLYFDHPVALSRYEVTPCDKPFSQPISVFANFDEWLWKLDPDAEQPEPLAQEKVKQGMGGEVDQSTLIHSLTFNFEKNKGFALCSIALFDAKGKQIELSVPHIVAGHATASSTLAPESAYSVMNLFDSRFESAWSSNHETTKSALSFNFDDTQTITRLRLWNGYQRSPEHCIANSRLRNLHIEGDNGYAADVKVDDVMGGQEIALPRPYSGKTLRLTAQDAYRGRAYPDLVISELRFGSERDWFMLDPLPHIREGVAANRKAFADAGLAAMLDDGLTDSDAKTRELRGTNLRIRGDGSFYLSSMVYPDGDDGEPTQYFAIGSYEIKAHDPAKGMQVRLFGLFHDSAAYGDCNGCGRDCNRPDANKEKIFQALVWLRPGKSAGQFVFEPTANKRLPRQTLILKLEK